jgi:hypothetical protein
VDLDLPFELLELLLTLTVGFVQLADLGRGSVALGNGAGNGVVNDLKTNQEN